MVRRDTRSALLDAALAGFAERGYGGTSIRDLAGAVGIKESSVYKHFPNKQALWDALLERTASRFCAASAQLGVVADDPERAVADYRGMAADRLVALAEALFDFHLHDPSSVAFRRLLTVEQFRDPAAGVMLRGRLVHEPIAFQTVVFTRLFGLPAPDAERLAVAFWGPIHLLVDLAADDEPRARLLLRAHVRDFAARLS